MKLIFLTFFIAFVAYVSAQTTEILNVCRKSTSCNAAQILCCSDLYTDPYYKLPVEQNGQTLNICISKLSKRGDKVQPADISVFPAAAYYVRNACWPTYTASTVGARYLSTLGLAGLLVAALVMEF